MENSSVASKPVGEKLEFHNQRNQRLLVVLLRVSPFLLPEEILEIICINRFFYQHSQAVELLFPTIRGFLSFILQKRVTNDTCISDFFEYSHIKVESLREIWPILSSGKNLILNPCGKQDFQGWNKEDNGDGWAIENADNLNETCFVSSFEWCHLTYTIHLKDVISQSQGKKLRLVIGSLVSRRWDCGSTAKCQLKIQGINKNRVANATVIPKCISTEAGKMTCPWELLSVYLDLKDGDEIAYAKFSGKDEKRWAGNYGARFGYCFARIFSTK